MKPFKLIKIILVLFFFARAIRLIVTVVTGNYVLGALVGDVGIAVLICFYLTYCLGVKKPEKLSIDRFQLFLVAILLLAVFQSLYFANAFGGMEGKMLVRAFSSFRKIFMPLGLLFLFSFLLRTAFLREGEAVFQKLDRLFLLFLYAALSYQFAELVFRAASETFSSFYIDYISAVAGPGTALPDIPNQTLVSLLGIETKRVIGFGLDNHLSAAIIFLCYFFHVFISGRFKLTSGLNAAVFLALLFSGSRQFLLPYLLVGGLLFLIRQKKLKLLAAVAAPVSMAALFAFLWKLTLPTYTYDVGYFSLLGLVVRPVLDNALLFVIGRGPMHMTVYGAEVLVGELQEDLAFQEIANFGFLMTILEAGLLGSLLYLWFHLYVFRIASGSGEGAYSKALKRILILNLVVFLAHQPILFDRTVIVFHVFLISLLYSWSRFKVATAEKVRYGLVTELSPTTGIAASART